MEVAAASQYSLGLNRIHRKVVQMEYEEMATGLQFPEGPVALDDGSVLVVEIRRQTLSKVLPSGSIEVVAEVGGGPNGAAIGPDGAVYIANNGGFVWRDVPDLHLPTGEAPDDYTGGRIERVDIDSGSVKLLYSECDGEQIRGPNDLVFDKDGNMWFTDTGKGVHRGQDLGALYFAASDGSFIREVAYPLWTPNGVGLSPDGSTVYVAETVTGRLWKWDITGSGTVRKPSEHGSGGTLVLGLPGNQYFDSLGVEADGKIDVATMGDPGISVVEEDGSYELVPFPDPLTTNICFGGPDLKTAYITQSSTGKLLKAQWPRPGLRLNF